MAKDMTSGSPGKTLFLFAVPMVLGNLFQQLYNIVDSIVVGNYVGPNALAAVGASSSITFLFIAIATGLGVGSSVVISQYFGAGQYGKMKTTIFTALTTSLCISALLMAAGFFASPYILRAMKTPPEIMGDASAYLRIYFSGLIFLFLYNTLTAVFNALGDSKIPLMFLALSSVTNVVLDLVFVTQFNMGVSGVAYATLIAQGISAVLSFLVLIHRIRKMRIQEEYRIFDGRTLGVICKIAVPSTIQQSIVSIGFILVQSLVNQCGPEVMAGYTAATKIDGVAIMPMVNVGNAISTFTAQNIGAKKPDRVPKGIRAGLVISSVIAVAVSVVLFLFGGVFVSAFVDTGANSRVIAVGVEYLRVVGVCYIVMGTMNAFSGVLRGSGDIKVFLVSSLCNLGTRVLLAYSLFYWIGEGAIWYAIPVGWAVGLTISFFRYRTGIWREKAVI